MEEEIGKHEELLKLLLRAQNKIGMAILGAENIMDFEKDIEVEDCANDVEIIKTLVESAKKILATIQI